MSKLIDFILSANSTRFKAGLNDAARSSKASTGAIGRDFGALNAITRNLTTTILSLAGAGGFIAVSRQVLTTTDALAKLSRQTGISVENLSTLQFQAGLAGASNTDFEKGVKNASLALDQAKRGVEGYGERLNELLRSQGKTTDSLHDGYDVLLLLADTFKDLPDGPAKLSLAYEILGKSGTKLVPLLTDGADALREQQAAARALGQEVSTNTAQSAERFNDSLTQLTAASQAFVREGLTPMLPLLSTVVEDMAEGSAGAGGFATDLGNLATVIITSVVVAFAALRTGIRQTVILLTTASEGLVAFFSGDFKRAFDIAKLGYQEVIREGEDYQASVDRLVNAEEIQNRKLQEQADARARVAAEQEKNAELLQQLEEREKAAAEAARAREALQKQETTAVDNLERQLALIDATTNAEKVRYEIARGTYAEFSTATQQRLLELAQELDAQEKLRAEAEAAQKAADDAAKEREKERAKAEADAARDAERKAADLQALADKFRESTRTEVEQLEEERRQLESVRDLLSGDEYDRAFKSIEDRLEGVRKKTDEWAVFTDQAARNLQDSFADFLFDPFEDGLDGMLRSFLQVIHRMVSELLAQQALRALFSGTSLAGAFGLPGAAEGGLIQGPGTGTSDSVVARVSNGEFIQPARSVDYYGADFMEALRSRAFPRFAQGGLVGSRLARYADGGPVAPGPNSGEPGAAGAAPGIRVVNVIDPGEITAAMASSAGEKVILNVISRNAGRVRSTIGGG
ncbi:MAG: hypothetical protein ACRCVK_11325 [Aeromonas veronii]